jgi:transcription initiation factor TFIIIB Brf1 subunit/transcription initiation factor TFIIB
MSVSSANVCPECSVNLIQEMCPHSEICEWVCPRCGLVSHEEGIAPPTYDESQQPKPLRLSRIPLSVCMQCGEPVTWQEHRSGCPSYYCHSCRVRRKREKDRLRQRRHRAKLAVTHNRYTGVSSGVSAAHATIVEAVLVNR